MPKSWNKENKLCILNNRFGILSQTFVESHIKSIAPGHTVRLGFINDDASISESLKSIPAHRMQNIQDDASINEAITFLKQQNVGAILVEFGTIAVQASKLLLKSGIPFFIHFHGVDASVWLRRPRYVRRLRALIDKSHGAFVPSRFIAQNLEAAGIRNADYVVTPCGVHAETFSPSSRPKNSVLATGRMVEKKSPPHLILAFEQALKINPDLHLNIVGAGELLNLTKELAKVLRIEKNITFHGGLSHEDVKNLFQQSSIFLQHSITGRDGDTEGLPVAVLEAMACEIPVVSTIHSGIAEAVDDGKTGYLVDEMDYVSMGEKLGRLSLDQNLVDEMGKNGYKRFTENFTIDITAGKISDTILKAL